MGAKIYSFPIFCLLMIKTGVLVKADRNATFISPVDSSLELDNLLLVDRPVL